MDAYVSAGDGMRRSNTFTLSAIDSLLGHQVTRENYPLVMDVLRLLGLERAGEIEEHFEKIFAKEDAAEAAGGTVVQEAEARQDAQPDAGAAAEVPDGE